MSILTKTIVVFIIKNIEHYIQGFYRDIAILKEMFELYKQRHCYV